MIPWRPAPSRLDAFEQVVAWYERTLPEFAIRTLDTDASPPANPLAPA